MLQKDLSGARAPYFVGLQAALQQAGITQPTLILDKTRLERNLDQLAADVPSDMGVRLVAKSLPVPRLLQLASERLNTHRFMTFNTRMLKDVVRMDPDADQLLGKPVPVAAARHYYADSDAGNDAGPAKVCWLLDTSTRIAQYAALAQSLDRTLDVALEIDVGLHRGGFTLDDLPQALQRLRATPNLNFRGLMGYEVHLASVPTAMGLRERATHKAWGIYLSALTMVREVFGPLDLPIRNTAGSPTFRLYNDTHVGNEVSVGSVLVKPAGFDTDLLDAYAPALFIATPVLKAPRPMQTPFLEPFDRIKRLLNPNLAQCLFVHGGYWKADPVDPPGLSYNPTYGRSSNQEILTGGRNLSIQPDEFVFLRPTQSEAIMMQFGEIAIFEGGQICDRWTPMPTST